MSCSIRVGRAAARGLIIVIAWTLLGAPTALGADYLWNGTNNPWNSQNWTVPPDSTLVAGPTSAVHTAAIHDGTVYFTGHDSFGNDATTDSPYITIGPSGALRSNGRFTTIWNLNLNGGTLLSDGGANANFPAFQLAGTLTVTGSQASTIGLAPSPLNGFTQINIGGQGNPTLTVDVANVTGNSDPDLIVQPALKNNMRGSGGGLVKTGAGTMVLSGANTYTGPTLVQGGTLNVAAGGSLNGAGLINATGGGILIIDGTVTQANGQVFSVGTGIAGTTGTVIVNPGGVLNIGNGGAATLIGGSSTNNNQYGRGILTIAGGTVNVGAPGSGGNPNDASRMWLNPYGNGGVTTVNLDGGVLSTARPIGDGGSGQSVFNFNGGTLRAAAGINLLQNNAANTINVRNGGAIIDTQGFTATIPEMLRHSTVPGDNAIDGGLTKTGAGTLTLTAASTYTGPTLVQGGTLAVAAGGSLVGTNLVNPVSGGTLTISGALTVADNGAFAVGSGAAGLGTVNIEAGAVVNIGNGTGGYAGRTYIGGRLDGAGSLGTGTLNINGGVLNVAAGGTGVTGDASNFWMNPWGNGGTSTLNLNGGTLSTARSIRDGGGGGSVVNFNGGTLRAAAGIDLVVNTISTASVHAGGLIVDSQNFNATISKGLSHGSGSPDGGLTKLGTGTLTLTAANSYTGTTTVSAGVLQFSGSGSAYSGGTFAGNIVVEQAGTLRFARHDTFGSAAANPAVTITVNGGTVTNSSGWFTPLGPVVLNQGTIAAGQGHSAWDAFLLKGTVTTVAAANSSYLTSTGANSAFHLNSTGTTFHVADGAAQHDLVVSGTLANYYPGTAGSLIKTGPGTMVLRGANTYTGGTVVNEGTLRLEGQTPAAWYDAANSATLRQDAGGTTPVTAGGQPVGLWQDVSGNAVHAAQASAGNRPTYSENGLNGLPALEFNGSQWINSSFNPNYTVVPDMTMLMVYQKVSDTGSNGLWGHDNGGWDRLQLLNFPANPGAANGISTGSGTAATPGVVTTDPLVYTAIMRNSVGSGSQVFINGNLNATFTQNHTNTGQASLTFGAINTGGAYPSNVRIGEIMLFPTALSPAERSAWEQYLLYKWGFSTALPQSNFLADNGPVTIAGGTLDVAIFEETVGAVTLQSGSIIGAGALRGSSFELQSGLVSAALVGPGTAVKTTSRTVLLSGQNTYTGPTAIHGGTLLVTGSLGDTTVTVNSGGTLGGTGTIGGNVSVLNDGALSPGTSVGTLNLLGNLAFEAGAFFDIDIAGPGDADLLMMDGGLLSPGDATIRVSLDFSPQLGDSWTILDGAGSRDGLFNPEVAMLSGSSLIPGWQSFNVGYGVSNGSHWVNLTLVPEPGTWLLLLSALACGLLVRRREMR